MYTFPNYQPNPYAPAKTAPPPATVTEAQKLAAIRAGASHIESDGSRAYRWRAGKVEQTIWYDDHWGMSWWQIGDEMPEGAIKLDE